MRSSKSTRKASVYLHAPKVMQAVVAAMAVLLVCFPLLSQGNQGNIQGGVFDQSGGAIAGATVTIIDASRGISRPLTTDGAGAYVGANLTPGTYTVRAEAKGFQTVEHPNVLVEVGQNIRVDLTLQPGAQTQTITVTSEVPAVNTTDATLGGTVNNQAINALPLNGRNYQRLLGLRPGVVAAIGAGTGTESSNDLRSGQNLTLIEGLAGIGSSHGGSMLNTSITRGMRRVFCRSTPSRNSTSSRIPRRNTAGWTARCKTSA